MSGGLFCRLHTLVNSENFDIRENSCQSPTWHPSHGGAALTRGGGRLRGLTGGRRHLCWRAGVHRQLPSIPVVHPPEPNTRDTTKPPNSCIPYKTDWWRSGIQLGKVRVCLVTVTGWEAALIISQPAGRRSPREPLTRCPGECRVLGSFSSTQTGNQLLQQFSCPGPLQRLEKVLIKPDKRSHRD